MELFGHVAAIEIGTLRLSGAAVRAQASYRSGGLGEAAVAVSLPSQRLLGALASDGVLCRVLAGWESTGAVEIARGYIVPDSVEESTSGDGDSVSWRLLDGVVEVIDRVVAEMLPSGTTGEQAFRRVAAVLGVSVEVVELDRAITYPTPLALAGRAAAVLDELATDAGCRWSLVAGRLRVWPVGGQAQRTSVVWAADQQLLALTTRAGGSGRVGARGLLTPSLRPGDVLEVRRRGARIQVGLEEVVHAIATDGSAWHTDVQGVAQ